MNIPGLFYITLIRNFIKRQKMFCLAACFLYRQVYIPI